MTDVDLAIVGAGPTGLFAAYYAGFRGLETTLIDALPEAGGQISALYPEKMIFDVAGFPAVRGRDLVSNLIEQAAQFQPQYRLGVRADGLAYGADARPVLSLSDGEHLRCGAVLLTAGMGSFTARPLPAAREFHGTGVRYFVPRLDELNDHDVVIVGGGDSAFDWAWALRPIARSVTIVHRRDRFRAHAGSVARVRAAEVDIMVNAEVLRIVGERRVTAVEVRTGEELRTLPADTVVAALGFTADLGSLADWGLELSRRHVVVGTTMATNLPRVFAAGDISDYPGKVRLIAVGFGEAATAVNNAAVIINPAAHLFPGHSSDHD
ncbi:MAG TPA: NAD(P)/FAD-dependent oxidoreductase [Actinoplanes sp.]